MEMTLENDSVFIVLANLGISTDANQLTRMHPCERGKEASRIWPLAQTVFECWRRTGELVGYGR